MISYCFGLHLPKTNDAVHLFICLFAIHISLVRWLFKSFANLLKTELFSYCILRVISIKYILLIMLLQLSNLIFSPVSPSALQPPPSSIPLHLSSCPWVVHISSLVSPFPILFLTPPRHLFYAYQLCFLFPVPFPHSPPPPPH